MFPFNHRKIYKYESYELKSDDGDYKVKSYKPSHRSLLVATYLEYVVTDILKKDSKIIMMPTGYTIQKTKTLKLFCKKGTRCICCGLKGEIFKEWREKDKPYSFLCLYGIKKTENGPRHILMTADHIYPKSLGGHNGFYNLQTMCSECNNKKGNQLSMPETLLEANKTIDKEISVSHKELLKILWEEAVNG